MQLQAGDVFDEFDVLKRIGSGSFSEVYLAHDTILDRVVVLKQLHPELSSDDSEWQAFIHEARMTASFFHPGLITVHSLRVKPEQNRVVLVMEYMDGGTLRDMLDKRGRLDFETLWNLSHQVGNALSYLHSRGIIHRDIKPENILYSKETGWFKLTDFGLAYNPEHPELEALNQGQPGTLRYMSPEQTQAKDILTAQSDEYSFAVVLYEALSGRYYLPVDEQEESVQVISQSILYDPPRSLPALHGDEDLLQKLEDILFKALAKHPLRRYRDVDQFIRQFKRVLDDLEINYVSA